MDFGEKVYPSIMQTIRDSAREESRGTQVPECPSQRLRETTFSISVVY